MPTDTSAASPMYWHRRAAQAPSERQRFARPKPRHASRPVDETERDENHDAARPRPESPGTITQPVGPAEEPVMPADSTPARGTADDDEMNALVEAAGKLMDRSPATGLLTVIERAVLIRRGADPHRFDNAAPPEPPAGDERTGRTPHVAADTDTAREEPAGIPDAIFADPSDAENARLGLDDETGDDGDDERFIGEWTPRPDRGPSPATPHPDADAPLDLEERESATLDPDTARDVTAQLGSRLRPDECYYPNLPAFVERFVAKVFPFPQNARGHCAWAPDWWKWPQLVIIFDSMWRQYEAARRTPGGMFNFYTAAYSMLDRVLDRDRGIISSVPMQEMVHTTPGEPLPCIRPPRRWRSAITAQLIASPPAPAEPDPPSAVHAADGRHD